MSLGTGFMYGNLARHSEGDNLVFGALQPIEMCIAWGIFNQEEFLVHMCEVLQTSGGSGVAWIQPGEIA